VPRDCRLVTVGVDLASQPDTTAGASLSARSAQSRESGLSAQTSHAPHWNVEPPMSWSVNALERTGKTPLSVTTDRIAYCAMRCASIRGSDP
jgi:hypothetical protein